MKLMVIPVGRSLVFSGSQAKNIYFVLYRSQAKNISYSTSNGLGSPKTGFPWSIPQMKLMVIPVGRSLVFSGSQTKNISYSTDHRQKIFRTLPQMAWGGEFFSSDNMWWLGDWTHD